MSDKDLSFIEMYEAYAILGADQIAAEFWLKDYAKRLTELSDNHQDRVTFEELIEVGMENVYRDPKITSIQNGEWLVRTQFKKLETEDEFWNQLSKYADIHIPNDLRKTFFASF